MDRRRRAVGHVGEVRDIVGPTPASAGRVLRPHVSSARPADVGAPRNPAPMQQQIRFCKTADGVRDGNKQWIVRRLLTPQEIAGVVQELLDSPKIHLGDPKKQRLGINVAGFDGVIHPAQLALLSPNVPDTLILNRIEL